MSGTDTFLDEIPPGFFGGMSGSSSESRRQRGRRKNSRAYVDVLSRDSELHIYRPSCAEPFLTLSMRFGNDRVLHYEIRGEFDGNGALERGDTASFDDGIYFRYARRRVGGNRAHLIMNLPVGSRFEKIRS